MGNGTIDKVFRLSSGELEVLVITKKKSGRRSSAATVTWLPCGKVELGKVGGASESFVLDLLSKFQRETGGDIEAVPLSDNRGGEDPVGILVDSGWLKLRGNRLMRVLQIE